MYITRPVRDPAGPRLPRGAPGPSVADRVVINLRQVLPVWMQIRLKFRSLTTDAPVLRPARSYRAANNLSPPLPPPSPASERGAQPSPSGGGGRGEGGPRALARVQRMLQTSAKCEASRAYGAASAVFNEYANRSPDSPRVPATEREREREREE
jgi:hypothetical protein